MTAKILWLGASMSFWMPLCAQLPDVYASLPKLVQDSNQIISCRVKSKSKPILSIFVNRKKTTLFVQEKGYSDGSFHFLVPITIPASEKPTPISIEAACAEGVSSILLATQLQQPMNAHILSIGIKSGLNYTLKDASDFRDLFNNQQNNKVYRLVNQDSITNATTSTIIGKLNALKKKYQKGLIKPNDIIILHLSSHGDLQDSTFFIKPTDYQAGMPETGISGATIQKYLGTDVKCKKILFIDACKSGAISPKWDEKPLIEAYKKLPQGLPGWVIFTSSDDELSYESHVFKNGLLTGALKDGLIKGLADQNKDNLISIQELGEYLRKRVPAMCLEDPNLRTVTQYPQLINATLPPTFSIFQVK